MVSELPNESLLRMLSNLAHDLSQDSVLVSSLDGRGCRNCGPDHVGDGCSADVRKADDHVGGSRLPRCYTVFSSNAFACRDAARQRSRATIRTPFDFHLRSDPSAPAALGFGRESIVYINPYTGEILGEGTKGIRTFFRVVTDWHRWLGAKGENRPIARAITGACNLGFLFLVVSGFFIWWPKQWTLSQLRNVTWFRRGLPGKARDFNWHNVIGFWSAIPLFIVVLSATVISYPWASNLVYHLVGEEPPVQGGAPGQTSAPSASPRSQRQG